MPSCYDRVGTSPVMSCAVNNSDFRSAPITMTSAMDRNKELCLLDGGLSAAPLFECLDRCSALWRIKFRDALVKKHKYKLR